MSTLYKVKVSTDVKEGDYVKDSHSDTIVSGMLFHNVFYVTHKHVYDERGERGAVIPNWYEGNPSGDGDISYNYHKSWLIFLETTP